MFESKKLGCGLRGTIRQRRGDLLRKKNRHSGKADSNTWRKRISEFGLTMIDIFFSCKRGDGISVLLAADWSITCVCQTRTIALTIRGTPAVLCSLPVWYPRRGRTRGKLHLLTSDNGGNIGPEKANSSTQV